MTREDVKKATELIGKTDLAGHTMYMMDNSTDMTITIAYKDIPLDANRCENCQIHITRQQYRDRKGTIESDSVIVYDLDDRDIDIIREGLRDIFDKIRAKSKVEFENM